MVVPAEGIMHIGRWSSKNDGELRQAAFSLKNIGRLTPSQRKPTQKLTKKATKYFSVNKTPRGVEGFDDSRQRFLSPLDQVANTGFTVNLSLLEAMKPDVP